MNTNKKMFKSAINSGLIMAGVFMIIDVLFYVFDFTDMGMFFSMFLYLVMLALYFILFISAGRNYRNKFLDGYMKYGNAIIFCLIMAAVYLILMFVYSYLFYNFFDPERSVTEMQKAAEMIQNNSYIPDEAKEEAMNKVLSATTNSILIRNLTNNAITGVVIAAISALFIRRKEKISDVF